MRRVGAPCYFLEVGFGLEAPAAVPVEIRAGDRRVYRLSSAIGDKGLRLVRPAPFELGQPVELRFALPDSEAPLTIGAEVEGLGEEAERDGDAGGCGMRFIKPHPVLVDHLLGYVLARLSLPPLPPLR